MATWKKVIVSGSSPELASVTLDTDLSIAHGGTGASTAPAAASALGVGTEDSPQFTAVEVGHANDTTIGRASAGDIKVQENIVYRAGGTNVAIADGGTNANDAAAATTNLGVGAASAVTHASLETTGNVSGSSVSTGSFGMLIGDGAGITNLTSAAISTYNSSGNDRILTSVDGNTVQGESTLTFNSAGILENTTGVGSKISGSIQSTGSFGHVIGTTYVGDGSGLTGVTQDIDNLDAFSGVPHATDDEFLISNSGVEERATMTMLANGVFAIASDSGDATIGADGGITIPDNQIDSKHYAAASIDNEHLADDAVDSAEIASGAIDDDHLSDGVATGLASGASNGLAATGGVMRIDLNELGVETSIADADFIPMVDASDNGSQKITYANLENTVYANVTGGDITINSTGVAAIGNIKVTDAMLNDDVAAGLAGTGTTATSGVLNVIGGDGITAGADEIEVTVDDSTIGLNNTNGGGAVYVKNVGIGSAQIAAATLASQGGLTGGAGTAIEIDFGHSKFTSGHPSFGNLTVTGDLTVQGTTTTLDTQNLLVEDNFIFAATGSAGTNIDGGLIVQSGSADQSGSAIMHDTSAQRWAVAKSIGASAGSGSGAAAVVPSAFVSTVQINQATDPGSTSGSYGEGEMYITQAEDIWIRTG